MGTDRHPESSSVSNSNGPHPSHETRISFDSSLYDEICVHCGATDLVPGGWGKLAAPCPKNKPST